MMNRNERTNMLNNAGVNTSGFFDVNMRVPVGAKLEILVDGKPMSIDSYGNIEPEYIRKLKEQIGDNGYVKNTKLWRRFVTAQTFRALNYNNYRGKTGWNVYMNDLPYKYQFKMLQDELHVQTKLWYADKEAFAERNQFFNQDVVVALMKQYLRQLKKYVNGNESTKKKIGKTTYVVLAKYGKVPMIDMQKIYIRFNNQIIAMESGKLSPSALYDDFYYFASRVNKLPNSTPKCPEWKNAYKASGAYYTLKNMIMFHNIILDGCVDMESSLKVLELKAKLYKGNDGWRLHEYLKKVIADNNFDLASSIEAHK